jgi:hypothetical protein
MCGEEGDDSPFMEVRMEEEDKEKGFAVRDKRVFADGKVEDREDKEEPKAREEPSERQERQEQERSEAESREDIPLPEINFSNFIFSLSTSALIQLGEIPDPVSNQTNKNLPMAKQTIDILGILQEKTKGNLTSDEEALIQNVLYDLRMRYVQARD